ncbi:major capsid protein [Serratia phage vB_SmaM-Susuwatari]|nr:major capsid protein [Serratia phage vB_SmaM-Susuwatari]
MSLQTLQEKVRSAATQLLSENLNVWNAASAGTLVMGSAVQMKDLIETLSWGLISGLVVERNAFANAGTPAERKVMAQLLANSVRLDGRVGPLVITSGMLSKLNAGVGEIAATVAAQAAQGMIDSYVKVGMGAANAAIQSGAYAGTVTTQVAPIAGGRIPVGAKFPTLIDMELATVVFGDQTSNIKAWFMSGAQYTYFKAFGVLTNTEVLFKIDTVRIEQDASGRRFVITDAPALGDNIIGLSQSGVVVNAQALAMESDKVLGGENIEYILQGEFSYDVAVKGYKLKSSATATAGSESFKQATLLNKANWEAIAKAGVDNPPASLDGAVPNIKGGGKGGSTGVNTVQNAQTQPGYDVKETAGVILTLTPAAAAPAGGGE